ncbi:MAG: ABC transporter ATP-binding protein [Anaerolineales bacterium]|nr:ABC transporter ATP-binding protein [Anaerolineales bacterium]
MKAIETTHLSKHFGDVAAVDDLSLQVNPGEIYAFLGLNGAGKTTTIRMLLGMIKPDHGAVDVLGTRVMPGSRHPWEQVGYIVETPSAYPELSVRENLEVARRLHPGTPVSAVDEIIEQLRLNDYTNKRANHLSLGNKQRLGLAKALLHRPRLLLLDEPANGLDPAGIVEVRQLLKRLAHEEGVTVFISSHILGEISRLAQRIGIIHHGRLLQEMSVAELEQNRKQWLNLATRDNPATVDVLKAAGYAPALTPQGRIHLNSAPDPEEIVKYLVAKDLPPIHLAVEQEDLEDYFFRLIGIQPEVQYA